MGKKPKVIRGATETIVVYLNGKAHHKVKLADKIPWKPHWFYERIVPVTLAIMTGLIFLGAGMAKVADAMQPIIKEVPTLVEVHPTIPILDKIAKCESGGNQFDKNGKVIKGKANKADTGKYQINIKIWGAKAKELGLDLNTLEGNKAMATWIFFHKGSVPWVASSKCWNK